MSGVLEGIRVLDFGRYIAGPFCGAMLGDLGAEVIRIEKLDGSEDRWVTPVVEGGEGAMFLQMGRNKLGLTLNPMKPAGREIVKKLLAQSDVVIANLPYETLQEMGIDHAKSGKGQKVETALLRTAMNITNGHLIEQAMLNLNRIATLNRGFTAGPSDTFKCSDGWIYAMTIGQPLFVRWCKLMGDEGLAKDPRFKDDLARGDNGETLSAIMQKWCNTRTVKEALEALEANRIPAGPVYTPQQTLDDPHIKHAKFFHAMEYPGAAKPVPVVQEPVKLSRTPLTVRRRAPTLGEHTDQILQELGYEPAVIEKLRADRVV